MRTGGGYALHRGFKVTTQLKTSENSWKHWKTSKIIWYHPENNWGPIIDNLVQFEEDFNGRIEKWSSGVGVDRLSQTRPIPRSPDGDNNNNHHEKLAVGLLMLVAATLSSALTCHPLCCRGRPFPNSHFHPNSNPHPHPSSSPSDDNSKSHHFTHFTTR